jgi:pimeloyl-ACP methyl ester carboxylesterase
MWHNGSNNIYRSSAGRAAIARWCADQLDSWPVAHERRMLTVHGEPTHVVIAGDGPRTVVFVPGTNFSAASCLPLATALAARARLVLADLPGQPGLSSGMRVPARHRLSWYGHWLAELIARTAEGPVVVMGHSLGAAIAMSSNSPLVERQVLVSPGGLIRARIRPAVLAASVSWLLRRDLTASDRMLRTMLARGNAPRPELADWMTLIARHVRSSSDPGRAPIADQQVDRAVVVGEDDTFFPPRALAPAVRRTLRVELDTITSAGHLISDEHPDQLAAMAAGPAADR